MKKITTLSLMFLLTSIFINAQTIITVDNSVGADADHATLEDAITAASPGDIIYVHASEINYGDISIDKSLTLIGFSHSAEDKKTMVNTVILEANASNTRISGFNIRNDFFCGNPNTLNNLIIENNLFQGSISDRDIYFFDGGADDVIFRGNIIDSKFGRNISGTTLQNPLTNVIISNNIIMQDVTVDYHESTTIENNIFLGDLTIRNRQLSSGDLEVEDCIIYVSENSLYNPNNDGVIFNTCMSYNDVSGVTNLVGNSNINDTDPEFVNATNDSWDAVLDDYTLQPTSDALGNGTAGDDIGIYSTNTNFTFNNFGYTAGIPIVTITDITSQIAPGGTLNVTIESNSN